jgi:hypothetical protein
LPRSARRSTSLSRAKRALALGTSALFTVCGIFILVFGSREDIAPGLLVTLFFGGCTLVFLTPAFARSRGAGRRADVVAHRGARTPAVVFPLSRTKVRVAGIAAAFWAVAGGALVGMPSAPAFYRLLGLALVVLFGGLAVLTGVRELKGHGFVALVPDGVFSRTTLGNTFVPWEAVDEVGVMEMNDTPLVFLRATDPRAIEKPRWTGLFTRANRSMIDADVTYGALIASEHELVDAIGHYLEYPEERARIGQ